MPGSNLPAITDPLIIDGTTISGYASGNPGGEPVVEIAGGLITPAITAEGLAFYEDADGSVVRGLSLIDFFECAVCVDGADAVVVESNRIGVRANGNANGTWGPGIRVIPSSAGTRIGDDFDPATGFIAAGNLLSANGAGIGDDGTGTLIAGNWVGLSPDGLTGAPWGNNLSYGVELGGSQTQLGRVEQLTGGGTVASGNIITGNETGGVYVFLANDVQVRANWIGLSPDGLAAVGNGTGPGLDIADSSDVVVGDTGVGANVISGHLATGILLRDLLPQISQNGVQIVGNEIGANTLGTLGDPGNFGPGIEVLLGSDHSIRENLIGRNSTAGIWLREGSANVIQANHIGTNAAGDDLGNGSYGVLISGTSENVIGADVTSAAADVVQLGNTIGYNGDDGILLSVGPGLRNTFRGNRFHDTTNAPIDIAGAAANDPGDGDAGSNNLQNSPELDPTNMFFDPVLQQIGVDYVVNSAPLYTTYPIVVDFYSLTADGISPLEWIGSDTIPLAEASVLRTSVFTPEFPLAATDSIIAIATDARGNSSEAGNVVFLPSPPSSRPSPSARLGSW